MKAPRAFRRFGALVGAAFVAAAVAAPASAPAAPLNAHFGTPSFASPNDLAGIDALSGTDLSKGISTREAGCDVKGLGGFSAALPTGAPGIGSNTAYLYAVRPIVNGTPTTPVCMPIIVFVGPAPPAGQQNLGFLQWEETPGATQYQIYRGAAGTPKQNLQLLTTIAGPVPANTPQGCPPSNPVANDGTNGGTYHARRCNFTDAGQFAPGAAIGNVYPAAQTQAGSHPDFKMVQRMDYGGTDNTVVADTRTPDSTPPGEEPFTCGNPGTVVKCVTTTPAANEAIKTDLFHFPDGLIANPRSTLDSGGNIQFCARTGPNSLLGDPNKFGSQDPDEDTCPLSTKVGTVQTTTRIPNAAFFQGQPGAQPTRLSISFGDIYNAAPEGTEAGRLFVVIRPACSAGHPQPFNPSGGVCQALVPDTPGGGPNDDPGREVEKEFQAAVANIVPSGANGQYRIDTNVVDERTGGDIENFQQVLTHTTPGNNATAFEEGPVRIARQVRVIQQELWGFGSTGLTGAPSVSHDDPATDTPFMTLPTSCQQNRMIADKTTWETPEQADTTPDTEGLFLTENCQNVPFQPGLVSEVDTNQAEDPVANATTIAICSVADNGPNPVVDNCPADPDRAIHQSHVMRARATFPRGLVINSSAGNFITAVGVKIGDVEGFAEELGDLGGDIILKRVNPDNSFVIQAEIRPVDTPDQVIPIEGLVTLNQQTGQISADFDNLPQLPFKQLQLRLGGQGIPKSLVNPPTNGENITHVELIPWCTSVTAPAAGTACTETTTGTPWSVDDKFTTTGGVDQNGPDTRPFAPRVDLKVEPSTANQDGNMNLAISKEDRQQNLRGFQLHLPNGLLANLGALNMCPASQVSATEVNCSEANKVGTATVASGNGPDTLKLSGDVFITEPLVEGDVAGMAVKIPAVVGPFNLGNVITRSRLKLDANRLGVDVQTIDDVPTILQGFPVRIRGINLTVKDLRNPPTCDAQNLAAEFSSQGDPTTTATEAATGATAQAGAAYAATGCDDLAFNPKVTSQIGTDAAPAAVNGHPEVTNWVRQPDHEAVIKVATVTQPFGLNANLAALNNTCSAEQAAADASQCPEVSKIGSASASSPLIPNPLTGPVYLVNNPGGLPKVLVKLSGLINQTLEGNSQLINGRLVTEFPSNPATPVSEFRLTINGGPNGLFTVGNDLCAAGRTVDGAFQAHTGQRATDSSVTNYVGNCVPVTARATSRRARLSVRVSGARRTPTVRIVARKATEGSARLSTLRVKLPSRLAVSRSRSRITRGVRVTAGGKRLARSKWTLSRSGVLTVRGLPKSGRSIITATLSKGAVRAGTSLRRAAVRGRTLPRVTFTSRIVDVNGARYTYSSRVRPTR